MKGRSQQKCCLSVMNVSWKGLKSYYQKEMVWQNVINGLSNVWYHEVWNCWKSGIVVIGLNKLCVNVKTHIPKKKMKRKKKWKNEYWCLSCLKGMNGRAHVWYWYSKLIGYGMNFQIKRNIISSGPTRISVGLDTFNMFVNWQYVL